MALFGIIFAGALIFAHPVQSANDVIKLATTTSTVNSGLMSYLIPILRENRYLAGPYKPK